MDDDDEKDWVLRFRISSPTLSLEQLESVLGATGGMGSFSVGDKIHETLQSLEKAEIYDLSRLQLCFEFKNAKSVERKALRLLDKLDPGLKRVRRISKGNAQIEWGIEYYGKPPLYYTASPAFLERSAKYGIGLHLVVWPCD